MSILYLFRLTDIQTFVGKPVNRKFLRCEQRLLYIISIIKELVYARLPGEKTCNGDIIRQTNMNPTWATVFRQPIPYHDPTIKDAILPILRKGRAELNI